MPENQPAYCQLNDETCLAEKTYPDNKSDGTCKYRYTRQELMDLTISAHLPRSTRKRLFHLYLWNPLRSSSMSRRGVNHHVQVTHKNPQKTSFNRRLTFGVWNARSVRNKTVPFMEYVNDKQLDIVGITETWLSTKDSAVIGELTQKFLHVPRGHTSGGGVGLLYKESLQVKLRPSEDSYCTFESLEVKVTTATACFILVIAYRTCNSSKNKLTNALFLKECTDFLYNFVISFDKVVRAGDLKYHVDSISASDAQKFISLLDSYSFTQLQLVKGPTHNKGHTLDLLISRSNDNFVSVQRVDDISLSDHHFIMCQLEVSKPRSLPTTKKFRRFKALDREKFANDLLSTEITEPKSQSLDELVAKYNTTLSDLLDEYAPLMTVPPATCPWYDNKTGQALAEEV